MKLSGSVTLGTVISFILYYIIALLYIDDNLWGPAVLYSAFVIVFPIALFLGSVLTGILSYPSIDFKWELFYFAPGLYLGGLCIVGSLFIDFDMVIYVIIMGLYWYMVSLAGTGLGYLLRSRIRSLRETKTEDLGSIRPTRGTSATGFAVRKKMRKNGIYILVGAMAVVLALFVMKATVPSFRSTLEEIGWRFVFWCLGEKTYVQIVEDMAEDIETKIGAAKLQAWSEETLTRYEVGELLTDGNSPYWSGGDIKLADEEIPEFIKNVWPKQPDAILQEPDVSILIRNGEPLSLAISWYPYGVIVGPTSHPVSPPLGFDYTYQRQVKPGICVYVKDT
jgi:hypothetical protein